GRAGSGERRAPPRRRDARGASFAALALTPHLRACRAPGPAYVTCAPRLRYVRLDRYLPSARQPPHVTFSGAWSAFQYAQADHAPEKVRKRPAAPGGKVARLPRAQVAELAMRRREERVSPAGRTDT